MGALQALGVAAYCASVALFITNIGPLLDGKDMPGILIMTLMLMFLVFSVAAVGTIIFGYPAYLALNQRLHDAFMILGYTISFGILFILSVVTIGILFL